MGRIQREILRLCIALLNHPLQDNEYQNVIISGLAMMGIWDDDGWLDAKDYTPKYSAIIKLARLIIVQEGYEQRQDRTQQQAFHRPSQTSRGILSLSHTAKKYSKTLLRTRKASFGAQLFWRMLVICMVLSASG